LFKNRYTFTRTNTMLKYSLAFILLFSLIGFGCNDDQSPDAPPQEPMQDQQMQQQQQPAAATDVTDEELDQFVNASTSAQQIQMDSQQEMITIVENEGLAVETYNQIAEGRQMGQTDDEINVSAEDLERYDRASESIAEVERDIEADLTTAIEDEGMDMQRFQEINIAIQQDPELQQRVQEKMQESFMQEQPQQPEPENY
jgi:hypothetical protein